MNRRRAGIMMYEMLLGLILISAFFLVAGYLFHATMRTMNATAAAENSATRLDSALRQLRADAWNAQRIENAGDGVRLTSTGGESVQWSISQDGTFTRAVKGAEQHWKVAYAGSTLRGVDAVILTIPDAKQGRGGTLRLVSQIRLAEGKNP